MVYAPLQRAPEETSSLEYMFKRYKKLKYFRSDNISEFMADVLHEWPRTAGVGPIYTYLGKPL